MHGDRLLYRGLGWEGFGVGSMGEARRSVTWSEGGLVRRRGLISVDVGEKCRYRRCERCIIPRVQANSRIQGIGALPCHAMSVRVFLLYLLLPFRFYIAGTVFTESRLLRTSPSSRW